MQSFDLFNFSFLAIPLEFPKSYMVKNFVTSSHERFKAYHGIFIFLRMYTCKCKHKLLHILDHTDFEFFYQTSTEVGT